MLSRSTSLRRWVSRSLLVVASSALLATQSARGNEADERQRAATEGEGHAYAFRLPEPERKRRLRELRKQANRWHAHRKRFPTTCHHCHGRGTVLVLRARLPQPTSYEERLDAARANKRKSRLGGWVPIKCPTCKGQKKYVSEKSYMKIYYEMRSPAFRLRKGSRDEVAALLEKARTTELPRRIRYASYKKGELVDPDHAIAWYRFDGDPTWRPTRWIWRADGGRKSTWYAYHSEVDGPWPGESEAPPLAEARDSE